MKRNNDLIRKTMVDVEDDLWPTQLRPDYTLQFSNREGYGNYTELEIAEHSKLLIVEGLLEGEIRESGGKIEFINIISVTKKGFDWLKKEGIEIKMKEYKMDREKIYYSGI